MSTVANSWSTNISSSQNNSKRNHNTVIQIPQKNSKPRIFLLTRPSKPQLVRIESQTEQPHHQKKLNLPQSGQKIVATPPVTVESQKQTATIQIPFLSRSQVQTFSVKNNTNQLVKKNLKVNPVPYLNQSRVKEYTNRTLPKNPIILEQVVQWSPLLTETSNNQLQAQEKTVKNTITKSTVNSLNLSENNIIDTQDKTKSEIPLTLASMAGIELTGADMSLSQADMSGAMPPTATVEEINVPVFIDEYLQGATTSVTTNNIFNINNNNTSNNISKNSQSNEIGDEVINFLDTLENFEFDINMLTENCSRDKKTALEEDQQYLHQQQRLNEVGDDKQHQLELQMMLEKILFDNNNNNNNKNTNNDNNDTVAANIDITDDLFKVAPYTEINDFLSADDIDNSSFGTTQFNAEEAVDLNSISKDFSLDDCFINSQPTEIMFSSGLSQTQSQTSSQNLIYEISKAEPHITPKYSSVATTSGSAAIKVEECIFNDEVDSLCTSPYIDDDSIADCKDTKLLVSNPLKRSGSQKNQHILQKRLKLHLDTKSCREIRLHQQSEINTPKVIDIIDQFNDGAIGAAVDSIKTIYYDLIASSPKCFSVKSEMDDTTNDFSPPNTPYSLNSISNQTSFMNTAPSSPASSIATTSNTSITTKRGRGRPAKTHSDIPDHSQIQHLSESDQKKVLERAKNNEASRKSRLKHKERDNALEKEEAELKHRNEELEKEWEEWKKMENKLKAAVKRQYFQFQNDQ